MDATRYDRWFETSWGHYAFEVERNALGGATGALTRRRVLDVGCGTGRFSAAMEEQGAKVLALDIDPAMLAVAATRVRGPLVIADAHRLPVPDAAFDLTVAVNLCEFTSDPALVVAELARVTRPGGRVVVGSLNRRSPWGVAGRRRFRRAPWDTARFLSRRQLRNIGRPHGRSSVFGALFAPGFAPRGRGGRFVEKFGRRAFSSLGAFQVLTVEKPAPT